MGYYTSYNLEVEGLKQDTDYSLIENWAVEQDADSYLTDLLREISLDDVTWYDHEYDLRELSAAFPELTFILNGAGENAGDLWTKTFTKGDLVAKFGRLLDSDENAELVEVLNLLRQSVDYGLSPEGKDKARNLITKLSRG